MATTEPGDGDDALSAPGPAIERTDDVDAAAVPSGIQGPFFQAIGKRKRQGRDAKVLVTGDHGQTGIGKTNCCDFLGYVCDTTAEGFAPAKTTIDPAEFIRLYNRLEPGSAAIMEEAEQFDSRRSNSHENVDASQKLAQARVREIIAFLNLPDPSMIDERFERLADFWVNVEIRGRCRIYEKRINRTRKQIYYRTLQTLEWPNMDASATFEAMDKAKDDHLNDHSKDSAWVRESKVQDRIKSAVDQAEDECRRDWIQSLREFGLTGKEIASLDVVDVGKKRVYQIANDD